jgi:Rrf2 family protein
MKLTLASVYALHALAYMAEQKLDKPIPSHDIAKAQGVPERFLLKVLKPLVSNTDPPVLLSIKGPHGGYRLARSASDINLCEILEAVDGPISGKAPVPEPKEDKDRDRMKKFDRTLHGKFEKVCKETAAIIRKHLEKVHLSDFVARRR